MCAVIRFAAIAAVLLAACSSGRPPPVTPAKSPAVTAATTAPEPASAAEPPAQAPAVPPVVAPAPKKAATSQSPREPMVIRVGPGGRAATIAEAAKIASDGDTVEVPAGEYVGDVAVWTQKALTIRSVGGRARLVAGGEAAEGKGIWVIRDGDFTVEASI